MNVIHTDKAPGAIGPYSQGIKAGGLVFVSGCIPIDPESGAMCPGDIQDKTRRCIKNLEAILLEAGSSLDKVVKTTVFVKNLGKFAQINAAYAEFFKTNPPARSCVEVAALPKGAEIEIEAIAEA